MNFPNLLMIFCLTLRRLKVKLLFIWLMRFSYGYCDILEMQKVEECLLMDLLGSQVWKREGGKKNFDFTLGNKESLLFYQLYLILRVSSRSTSMQRVLDRLGLMVAFLGDFALAVTLRSQILAKVWTSLWTREDLFLVWRFHLLLCSFYSIICRQEDTLCRKLVYCFFFSEFSSVCLIPSSFSLCRNSRQLSLYFCRSVKILAFSCFSTSFSFSSCILSKRLPRLQLLLFFTFSLLHSLSFSTSFSIPCTPSFSNTYLRFLKSEKCLVSGVLLVPLVFFSSGLAVVVSLRFSSLSFN